MQFFLNRPAHGRRKLALLAVAAFSVLLAPVASAADRGLVPDRHNSVGTRESYGRGTVVTVPAGSVDALQAAVDTAGVRGVVLVETGQHTENGTVVIDVPVSIIGEPGAVIKSYTPPLVPVPEVQPALHVKDTRNVMIQGLELRPLLEGPSNAAILIENSPRVTIESNKIIGYTAGIFVQEGDRVDISGNEITLTGENNGIVIINGEFAKVTDNVVSNAAFGIWACDKKGHAARNTTSGSFIGIILCKVPPVGMIGGEFVGSEFSATGWHVQNNNSIGNFWGYAVTDGSADNVLANNAAADSGFVDIEVLGDSMFFGFFTPTVTNTLIAIGANPGLTIHDCGVNTTTSDEAILIDAPCF